MAEKPLTDLTLMARDDFSWARFYSYRIKVRNIYPSVYKIRIKKKLVDIIKDELEDSLKILDVGAYNRRLCEQFLKINSKIIYKSMDIDKSLPHDYYNLDEIEESFDIIVMSEVIEHLDFEEALNTLQKLRNLLADNGKIIISTPNIHHPNSFFRDVTHKVPYRYDELGAVLLYSGFKIDKIFRVYNDQFFKRLFRIYIASYLHRYLDIDFAPSIVIVGRKK